ncbi:MAG: hypothetical protein Q4A32_06645 [Lachnospiraceae bacterium]|nr:hypothetical protein [Lachnospiraceae bacterium]
MLKASIVIVMALTVFFATIFDMALKNDNSSRNVIVALTGATLGAFFYGYGFSIKMESLLVAIPKTVLAVCGMFVGRWEIASMEELPLFKNPFAMCLFLTAHFMAFYSFVNVVLMRLGSGVLKKIRTRLLKKNDLYIIYGISDETVLFANRLRNGWKNGEPHLSILFVPECGDPDLARLVEQNGWVCRMDSDAQYPNSRFLRSLGIKTGDDSRKIALYALSAEENRNRRYASELLEALKRERIPAENLSLTIYTNNTADVGRMQAQRDRYGYTDINSFELQSLTARLLTLEYPVYNMIRFQESGLACEDVDILIAGFGQTGQAVLRNFVRNGQFEGSHFHAAVFAPDIRSMSGQFFTAYEELCTHYSIEFHEHDARSVQAADYVRDHARTLKYIVACAGDEKTNWEIIRTLEAVSGKYSGATLFLICDKGTVTNVESFNVGDTIIDIWRDEILSASIADRAAKAVNASYNGLESSTEELWRACAPFSRESCRAAADFMRAYCRISGISESEAAAGAWDISGELLENLAKTEHLRWNAFHWSMGWKTMTDEEFRERAKIYLRQKENGNTALIRIAKNDAERHHACLVSWEELMSLSDRENAVTGKNVDYQQYDRDNVLAVPMMIAQTKDNAASA